MESILTDIYVRKLLVRIIVFNDFIKLYVDKSANKIFSKQLGSFLDNILWTTLNTLVFHYPGKVRLIQT